MPTGLLRPRNVCKMAYCDKQNGLLRHVYVGVGPQNGLLRHDYVGVGPQNGLLRLDEGPMLRGRNKPFWPTKGTHNDRTRAPG